MGKRFRVVCDSFFGISNHQWYSAVRDSVTRAQGKPAQPHSGAKPTHNNFSLSVQSRFTRLFLVILSRCCLDRCIVARRMFVQRSPNVLVYTSSTARTARASLFHRQTRHREGMRRARQHRRHRRHRHHIQRRERMLKRNHRKTCRRSQNRHF